MHDRAHRPPLAQFPLSTNFLATAFSALGTLLWRKAFVRELTGVRCCTGPQASGDAVRHVCHVNTANRWLMLFTPPRCVLVTPSADWWSQDAKETTQGLCKLARPLPVPEEATPQRLSPCPHQQPLAGPCLPSGKDAFQRSKEQALSDGESMLTILSGLAITTFAEAAMLADLFCRAYGVPSSVSMRPVTGLPPLASQVCSPFNSRQVPKPGMDGVRKASRWLGPPSRIMAGEYRVS